MKLTRSIMYGFTVLTIAAMSSCASSGITTVASFINKEQIKPTPYKSIFIMAMTPNVKIKTTLENDLAYAAESKGIKVYKSVEVLGQYFDNNNGAGKDVIINEVTKLGCEAIFIIALTDMNTQSGYTPDVTYSSASYYPTYGYYNTFAGYYANASVVISSPGYYQTSKTYIIESNLYDAKSQALVMTVKTKAVNPAAIEQSSKEYTMSLADEIERIRPVARR